MAQTSKEVLPLVSVCDEKSTPDNPALSAERGRLAAAHERLDAIAKLNPETAGVVFSILLAYEKNLLENPHRSVPGANGPAAALSIFIETNCRTMMDIEEAVTGLTQMMHTLSDGRNDGTNIISVSHPTNDQLALLFNDNLEIGVDSPVDTTALRGGL